MNVITPAADTAPVNQAEPAVHAYPLQFTASGSEYFRIWIVNMLLIMVTLGIYLPWAKVRKLQYFYSNTLLDGHGFDFHGDPLKMLRGTMVAGAFFIVYSIAGNVSGIAALLAALAFICIWPLLVRASLRFRLANTSWRGLRMRFTGSVAGAYQAVMPPLALLLIPLSIAGLYAEPGKKGLLPDSLEAVIGVTLLVFVLTLPYFFWRVKKYQHENYACGDLVTGFRARPGAFYMIALKTLGIVVLGVGLGFLLGVLGGILGLRAARAGLFLLGLGAFAIGALFINIVPKAYAQARLQNLVWTQTGNRLIRFRSDLAFRSYWQLQFKNFFLIVFTLGFYWPFASVSNMRARVEAMSLHTRMDLEELAAGTAAGNAEATGDAAADLFGLDMGL